MFSNDDEDDASNREEEEEKRTRSVETEERLTRILSCYSLFQQNITSSRMHINHFCKTSQSFNQVLVHAPDGVVHKLQLTPKRPR